jgi:hypothetical protein
MIKLKGTLRKETLDVSKKKKKSLLNNSHFSRVPWPLSLVLATWESEAKKDCLRIAWVGVWGYTGQYKNRLPLKSKLVI